MKSHKKQQYKVVLIGAGRLGKHLGLRLKEMEVSVLQVFSRTKRKAQKLGKLLDCPETTELKKVITKADLYIIAVHDSAIGDVAGKLSKLKGLKDKLVVHTSGATPSTVLKPHFKNYGVFYPLQTFSDNSKVDFSQIPICVDARFVKHRKDLLELAQILSDKVFHINDKQRAILHVAAVFVNNFSNHMFAIGEAIAQDNDLSFDLLRPLLLETANKVKTASPSNMQTGPAARNDQVTIDRHLDYLEAVYPSYADLYKKISQHVIEKK